MKVKTLSCVQLFETPWTAAYQAPPSMGFSRQKYWSGVPLPSLPGYLEKPLILLIVQNLLQLNFIAYFKSDPNTISIIMQSCFVAWEK